MKCKGRPLSILALIASLTLLALAPASFAQSVPPATSAHAIAAPLTTNEAKPPLGTTASRALGLPLFFEANQGQTDSQVKFLTRSKGYTLFLSPTETVLAEASTPIGAGKKGLGAPLDLKSPPTRALRMQLIGANPAPLMTGSEQLPGKVNYLIGNDPAAWHTGVPLFSRVETKEVYPGVDLVFHGDEKELEYDFVVAPGADPSKISFRIRGASRMEIDSSGDLVLHTAGSEFRMHKPIIYQTIASRRRAVRGSFVRKGKREVAFRLGAYDRSLPLIIDPAISFATFFGGNGAEDSFGIAVDDSTLGSPKLYVDGFTRDSTTFPESSTTIGSGTSTTPHVIEVGFVAKIDPTATGSASLIYLTFVGGKTPSISTKLGCGSAFIWLALDKSQGPSGVQPVLGGETSCSDFPTTVVLNPVTGSGMNIQGISAVATRLNPGGNAVDQSATLGGNNDVQGGFIAVNSAGDIILSGETAATNLPAKNAYVSNFNNGVVPPPFDDCFVSRLNRSDLSLNYLTYLNTGANSTNIKSTGCGAFEDSSGNILVGGNTFSTTAFNLGPGGASLANGFQTTFQGTADTFAMLLNPGLSGVSQLLYATYFAGGGTTQAGNGSFDLGNGVVAIVGGTTSATTGPNSPDIPLKNAFQSSNLAAGSTNGQTGYLLVLDSTKTGQASLLCSTYFGGSSGNDFVHAVAYDAADPTSFRIILGGVTASSDFPTLNPLQSFTGTQDGFVSVLKVPQPGQTFNASLYFSTLIGSGVVVTSSGTVVDNERIQGVAVDANHTIYASGYALSSNFFANTSVPTAVNGFQKTCTSCALSPASDDLVLFSITTGAAAAIQSITVTPASPSIAQSATLQFTATAFFTDGTIQDITNTAFWTSTNTTVASISNITGSLGLASASATNTGVTQITASKDGVTSPNDPLTVTAAPATQFSVTAPAAATAGTAFNFTVTALTAANATATGYTGTVHFTSTDAAASLPADTKLTSGIGTFSATLNTVSPQTITVTDANTASITGTSGNITVTASSSLGVGTSGTSTGTVMGNGIDCATGSNTGCLVNIPVGTTVTLTAAPTNGAMFAGWNAGPTPCTVSGAMCTFQMPTGSETVFATFNAVAGTPLLTVQILGTGVGGATGNGIACFSGDGTGCTIGIAAGTQVTLTEAPNAVSAFAGWGAPCSNTAMTCSFSMPAGGQFVTATFTATPTSTFTLTPNQLFFGPLALNTMSTSQPLAVTNNGAAAVTVNGISFAGNAAADFGQSNTCGTSVSGDGGHCAINVAATPKASGPRTADLSLASSDPASPAISHMTANGTIRQLPGFTTNVFPANDDGSTNAIPLPFSLNFFGATFSSLYVNNNGNVTFGQPLSTFTPTGLNGDNGGIPIIAPFWADVDTTGVGSSLVTYGTDTVNGLSAFGVDFENVGYFSSNSDKLNSFQVILIDRSDTGAGNFDMEFDYDKIQWEAGDASGGTGGLCGAVVPPNCVPAAVGYSNGTGTTGTNFQLGGSFVPGALLDGGPTATSLIVNSLNSATPGRYVFQVRNGAVQTADLSLTMSGKPNPVVAGTNETFTITATNLGPSDATNVTVTDTLPNNATLVSATPSQGAACTGTTTLSCNLGTLTVEALATVTVIVSVNANATGTVTNAASVISDQPDPNPANNSASASATITTAANPPVLSIMKSHAGTFTQGQQGAKYTVTVSNGPNAGPTSGTVTVTETAPAGLTLVSMAGTGWTCTVATATCTTTIALNAGGIYPAITVTVNVLGNATSPQVNQVGVTGGGSAPASTSDSTTIVAATPPILQIAKSHAGNFTQGQQGAKYTVTVSTGDAGSTNGTAVTMTDTVPAGLTLVSMAGAGWTCTVATATCTTSVALSANANYPSITVTVNVTATATSPQVNQVSVSGGGATAAASASDSTVITPLGPAVLTITKTHAADFTLGQQGAQYTVTVTNGPNAGPTNGVVTVTDAIPDGLSLVSMAGTGWTCTVATATCTTTTALNAGGIYPAITVTVNVSATSPAQVTNTVTVTGGGSAAANANDPTNVNAAPFTLVITPPAGGGTATPPAVSPGGQIAIGLTLTPISGFNGTVTLSCVSSAPQFITCAPAPSTVKISVGGTQVAIVINTFCQGAVPTGGPTNDPMNGPGGIVGALELLLAALSLASVAWAYRRRSRWALSFAALMLIAMGSAACNNLPKGPNGRTPPGNYTLFIKAVANGQGAMVQVPIQVLP